MLIFFFFPFYEKERTHFDFTISCEIEVGSDFGKIAICLKYSRKSHGQQVVVFVNPVKGFIIVRCIFEGLRTVLDIGHLVKPFVRDAAWVF